VVEVATHAVLDLREHRQLRVGNAEQLARAPRGPPPAAPLWSRTKI
jgi:hypothetical protein